MKLLEELQFLLSRDLSTLINRGNNFIKPSPLGQQTRSVADLSLIHI